jgi:hypothetical protein
VKAIQVKDLDLFMFSKRFLKSFFGTWLHNNLSTPFSPSPMLQPISNINLNPICVAQRVSKSLQKSVEDRVITQN